MELLDLFVVATIPVLKVLIVTGVGSFLAIDRIDILGEDARKHLNRVVFFVFNPALVAINLARTITFESMVMLWFMPFNILLTFIIGSALGWMVIQITKAPSNLRGLILGCCSAGNLGNMLLIIIPAVCREKGSPFGANDVCYKYGMAYSSLSMAIGAVYLWSYVFNIVRIYSRSSRGVEVNESIITSEFPQESSKIPVGSSTEALLPSKDYLISDNYEDQFSLHFTTYERNTEVPISVKIKKHLKNLCGKISLKALFAPSTAGAVVGFVVGIIPQIRRAMIGETAPLHVIGDSASLLSDGAIPSVSLVMGANLLKGLQKSEVQLSIIFGIIIVRYIALPLLGIVIVKGAIHFGWVHSDPLYQFILLLQFALPPAMNIGTMTQLFGEGQSECSVIMLWTYALASISLTLWSTLFMWLVA
ncbi:PREDICTED: protein PIN-LIKES 3-like [Nelumbo nucifera]|uniref:Protein PIN-LIKES 3-like n=2 Tax=Nelumbo nucifera TaxID=4432 RepID=A0A1U8AFD8_NELNU|nr:PREDICTED: protein PIN-LIKES 3-like [Nelumbo nucifera]XP_010266293.1 PREDICTED: protein PIN-LIKES 3-like [Nelumbo nucifera]XP_010266294.1 PREDICTED: protein PIN-LIKES 3-like [Nelumbo nucifera]XP_010266295.1 PREDICTED: protein PIN-LIKES 3-like [Nelumbo nucifera]XP_010266296.1 PREDICTED: protein PIN-LIKES 3-like [Nelumbo nucifera]XP_010266297.1 PREDICTED: protein PIN-LIKES 3-like [Nelumbo nucifera]DAD41895.1 TPA_asm: hypothetical protein HUJ06_016218 [Nelumbo nucifera]